MNAGSTADEATQWEKKRTGRSQRAGRGRQATARGRARREQQAAADREAERQQWAGDSGGGERLRGSKVQPFSPLVTRLAMFHFNEAAVAEVPSAREGLPEGQGIQAAPLGLGRALVLQPAWP